MRIPRRKAAPIVPNVGNRRLTAADEARAAARKDRRVRALELRTAGGTYEQIAKELGICARQVKNDVRRALEERGADTVDECRAIMNGQLDADLLRVNRALSSALRLAEGDLDAKPPVAPSVKAAIAVASLVRTKTHIVATKARINGVEVQPLKRVQMTHSVDVEMRATMQAVIANMSEDKVRTLLQRARERRRLAAIADGQPQ